jgi:hypothetical protein
MKYLIQRAYLITKLLTIKNHCTNCFGMPKNPLQDVVYILYTTTVIITRDLISIITESR